MTSQSKEVLFFWKEKQSMHKHARGKWNKKLLWPDDVCREKQNETPKEEWTCSQCTYAGSSSEACPMCGSSDLHPNPGSLENIRTTTWACPSCTFENVEAVEFCAICGASWQSEINGTTNPPSWACDQCSFENEGSALVCAMCSGGDDKGTPFPLFFVSRICSCSSQISRNGLLR